MGISGQSICMGGKGPFVSSGNKAALVACRNTSDSETLVRGSHGHQNHQNHQKYTCIYSHGSPTQDLAKQNLWGKAQESAFYPAGHVTLLLCRFECGFVPGVATLCSLFCRDWFSGFIFYFF